MKPLFWMFSLFSLCAQAQAQWLSPQNDSHNTGAAHVEKVTAMPDSSMTVKLFHSMPIDAPSMNPWFLRLAVVNEEKLSWNVYHLPNVKSYQVLPSAKVGYLKIAIRQDDYNVQTGKNVERASTLFINLHNANQNGGRIEIDVK
ncbi:MULTISPECIES: hypothetical protein [Vitreoscilla]|uniref:Uncharacterized protein n=1 Tax=Vitreoscilla stercoraria TaxID=61 RepID=A0ABY4E8B6_VITST|nr:MULTISPECIES: hypothetical protein [Vitreoscilla]AUZ04242.1 hypothetical protein ADP71_04500 [Vitreoscilla sp. C1]UOO92006.1 hypothetical protein LVJ81_10270 [Vitreoscilla stercoraria]